MVDTPEDLMRSRKLIAYLMAPTVLT